MLKRLIYLIVVIQLFTCIDSYSNDRNPVDKSTIRITVKVTDPNIIKVKNPIIMVSASYLPISGLENLRVNVKNTYTQTVKLDSNHLFIIPSPLKKMYIYIGCSDVVRSKRDGFSSIDNIYVVEAGSTLTCEIGESGFNFTGKGAEILNFQNKIVKMKFQPNDSIFKYVNNKQYIKYFELRDSQADVALKKQLEFIKANKKELGEENTKIFIANSYGYRYYSEFYSYDFEAMQNEPYLRDLKQFYAEKIKSVSPEYKVEGMGMKPNLPDSILALSPTYANYLLEELNIQERMKHEAYRSVSPHNYLSNILSKIKKDYSGILRDKLLTLFLVRNDRNTNALGFYDSTIAAMQNNGYKEVLYQFKQGLMTGQPFRDFKLADPNDKIYTLNNFKNKVVIMDFWYTGCTNCIKLTAAMKPVYDYFKDNNKVVFASISIDKSKETWTKSLESGKYTHDQSVNLYTNGDGVRNDLIQFYNIIGYPAMKIIKNGILFSSLPPIPTVGIQPGLKISKGATDLINLIEEALVSK